MKRNDVVSSKKEKYWSPYGRIWKKLPNGNFLWVDCKCNINENSPDELEVHDYKGNYFGTYKGKDGILYEKWNEMPTLKNLKRRAINHKKYWEERCKLYDIEQ